MREGTFPLTNANEGNLHHTTNPAYIMKHFTLRFALAAILFTSALHAQVPRLINYQGRVVVDTVNFEGTGLFKFALVNSDGSTTFWSNDGTSSATGSEPVDAVSLPVTKGLYSVLLGDIALANMTVIPAAVFANPDVRLRVWFDDGVNASQLLAPDQRLAPATYVADGAINSSTIADGAIVAAKIAPAAINGTHLAAGSLDFSHLNVQTAPGVGQVLGFDGASLNWTAPGVGDGIWTVLAGNAFRSTGNVGIGTSSPISKLHIVSEASDLPSRLESSGTTSFGAGFDFYHGATGKGYVGVPDSVAGFAPGELLMFGGAGTKISFWPGGARAVTLDTNEGFVGIGTAAPQDKLHLYDPDKSVSHRIETGGFDNSWSRVEFANANGQWNVGTSRGFNSDEFFIQRQGAPIAFAINASGFAARFTTYDLFLGHALRRGSPGRALVDYGDRLVVNFGNDWGSTVIGGLVTEVRTLRITGGADLAEPFEMKEEELEKGSVVVIDDEHPGRLKRSRNAYDTRVAGIISGANGVNPGIALHQEGLLEGGQNVALSGRVYVQADASGGPIKPGDLLTTSDTPGHAMKVTEHTRAQGSVIGKAMSSLNQGMGMVLVLVTLQ